ncbi:GntR family transcriptional regulator [Roseomonas chloroacetimidivorans]|uniref:GntR family transcriptional regulator n=1 Tax=Roseomonas chloroacetimidivorans TaxID=1766656 RepID=UPI003C784BA0
MSSASISSNPALEPSLLYRQLAALLRHEIRSGQLPAGSRLPTIAALAERHGVAASTVRQALDQLRLEGLIRSRQGSGTFVTDLIVPRPLLVMDLGWSELVRSIRPNLAQLLSADDTPAPLEEGDGSAADAYRHLRRVHRTPGGLAYTLVDIWLDRRLYDLTPQRFDREMVLPLLEDLVGGELAELRQVLRLGVADADAARWLGIPLASPIGVGRRILLGRDGVALYWARSQFRGDAVLFESRIRRP